MILRDTVTHDDDVLFHFLFATLSKGFRVVIRVAFVDAAALIVVPQVFHVIRFGV